MGTITCTRDEFDTMAEGLVKSVPSWRLHRKKDHVGRQVTWLEGSCFLQPGASNSSQEQLLVTFFLSYSECYSQPQLHFAPERPLGVQELCEWMTDVCPMTDEQREWYASPIVSMGFCEELQMALWSIHQCDVTQLLSANMVYEPASSLLELFLRNIGPLVGLDKHLLPSCSS
ncbi:hypothetical protein TRVL_00116 [Trypanosoma vivax]|uniref:Uncharacterized protein n=1 Tax=Trypanosoma vivax (strain Y486) TaxID=1055687 RepID=F9WVF3_TRYVY|nr:hypothetical protein TRVL_00116 [Trypanosoma vivax]CCD21561.1 hypothetical protein, conserved [Trypanosoma vivax Y486]|eukprot:CCD21561.1 hypothetical protein, conserved [Trypanosoma vivax Y486]